MTNSTPNADKPKKLRNFSVSKNFSRVHTILDNIDKQERSRFICEAILEKFNNMNNEQKTAEPMEQMKQMMEQYQMITSLINPVQQPMMNPAMMQMMQQPAYQQPIPDPAMVAQMQAQAYAQQVAQQLHTAGPVQSEQDNPTVKVESLQMADKTEQITEDSVGTGQAQNNSVENVSTTIEISEEDGFKPQHLFKGELTSIEGDTETLKPVEESTEEKVAKTPPPPKVDERLAGRRRGGASRQFM